MKRSTKVVAIAVVVFVVAAFAAHFIFADAVSDSKFSQINEGMTEVQVRELLGIPHGVGHDTPTTTVYYYGGFQSAKWCSMEVFFGADGRVTSKFHDH